MTCDNGVKPRGVGPITGVKIVNRTVRNLATALLSVSLIILCVLVPVHLVAFNLGFYRSQWEALGVPEGTGMSLADLSGSASALLGYFTGKVETPQVTVPIFGEERELYNAKELSHLTDVKSLFGAGLTLEQILAAEVLGIALYLWKARELRTLSRGLLASGGVNIALLAALAAIARTDFSDFWTNFHLLTFTNENWLLDPTSDWLVMMFPEGFFLSAVMRIGILASGISLGYLVLGLVVRNLAAHDRH